MQFEFDLLLTTSEKILSKVFGYDFTLKKPAGRIFRHIPTDCLEFEMTAKKWNYLITMTARIQNVISSTVNLIFHISEANKISNRNTWRIDG